MPRQYSDEFKKQVVSFASQVIRFLLPVRNINWLRVPSIAGAENIILPEISFQ